MDTPRPARATEPKPENRADALRNALEEQILTGVLRPGDRLEEVALADRFGVSRTPIREALFQLAATGLIEHRHRRGAFVADFGPKRLGEMFDVIAEMEALCARLAARRATAADLAGIAGAHGECAEAAAAGDSDGYYYANERFHQAIRVAAGNDFLVEQIAALQKRLKAYRRLQLRARGRIRTSFEEHGRILAALESGAVDEAGDAMRAHVAIQGNRFADLLASLGRGASRDAAE
jgi:DNA-binding GntR family transcriptional regulator